VIVDVGTTFLLSGIEELGGKEEFDLICDLFRAHGGDLLFN
jgi:hypothetical protein